MEETADWRGRFPRNEIISLLDVNRRYNLAESTAQDLTFRELLELAGGAAALDDLPLGYGSSAGLPRLRAAVAAQAGVRPDEVVTMQGAALGLFLLAFELCRPGDEAVIVTPCFPPARDTLVGAGVSLRECRLGFDGGYRLTAGRSSRCSTRGRGSSASPARRTRAGSGRRWPRSRRSCGLMRRKAPAARLFVDETYRDATYGDAPPPSAAGLDEAIITGGSVSKAHGAPGLRVGWLTVRDAALRARCVTAKVNVVLSGSPLDETLAAAVLENRETVLGARRRLLAAGVAAVADWVAGQGGLVDWVRPEGGALCCLRLDPGAFDAAGVARFWAALPEAGLQLADGGWFGESSRVMRLGFGYLPLAVLPSALEALSATLRTAARG